MRKYILFALLCLGLSASAQQYMYWYDGDIGAATRGTVTGKQMHFDADVSGLSYGLHTLNYALLADDGSITSIRFASFLKGMKTQGYVYWFDNNVKDAVSGEVTSETIHLDADISELSAGFHSLSYALLGDAGSVTSIRFASFLKGMKAQGYVYWFDNNVEDAVSGEVTSETIHLDADISELSAGFHTLNYALLGDAGSVTSIRFVSFVKAPDVDLANLRLVYQIDEGSSAVSDAQQIGSSVYAFSIDVAALSNGEHTISYMLTDGSYVYATDQATFTKVEVDGIAVITAGHADSDKVFNLQGMKVKVQGKNLYIVNGKKRLMK